MMAEDEVASSKCVHIADDGGERWRPRRRRCESKDWSPHDEGGFLGGGVSRNEPDSSTGDGINQSVGRDEGCPSRPDTQQEDSGGRGDPGGDCRSARREDDGLIASPRKSARREEDTLIASPRKKQRLRNLRLAKGMERAREKDIAVVKCWIPSVP